MLFVSLEDDLNCSYSSHVQPLNPANFIGSILHNYSIPSELVYLNNYYSYYYCSFDCSFDYSLDCSLDCSFDYPLDYPLDCSLDYLYLFYEVSLLPLFVWSIRFYFYF